MSRPLLFLVLATAAGLAVVPDWPHRHLDEPAYWGMIGYVGVFLLLVARRTRSWREGSANRRLVSAFLVGLPLIYVAAVVVSDAGSVAMAVEGGGLVLWLALAWSSRRYDWALWAGCVAHALWDAGHWARADYIPSWYVVACIAVDVGLGGYVLLRLREGEADAPGAGGNAVSPAAGRAA